jgi:GTP-binding protein
MTSNTTLPPDLLAAETRLFEMPWKFVRGVAGLEGLPAADRPEAAFAGRSNVGKSSLLNALVRQKSLARTSNTPGRTQELNFFAPADDSIYIVDLPGYGFAKAPKDKVRAWTELVTAYLCGRPTLQRVFLLIDSRHGVKPPDQEVMKALDAAAVTYQVVLTKADKTSPPRLSEVAAGTAAALERHPAAFPRVLATSAEKGAGISDLRATLAAIVRDYAS